MKFKYPIMQIAIASVFSWSVANEAMADPAGKAVSYLNIENIVFFPDNGADGNPDPGIDVTTVQTDIPATSSSANKIGVPDSGSSVLNAVANRGPLNVDQACVARPPNIPLAQEPPFAAPCPSNDTFSDVAGFPANNVARADAKVFAADGYTFPGNTCPADGEGACGIPGNTFADVTSIAEVQVNEIFEQAVSESDTVDTASFVLSQDAAVTIAFQLDWCRQAQLLDAGSPSIARAGTNANIQIRDQSTGQLVFDANASGLFPDVIDMNGVTELLPSPAGTTGLISEDVLNTPGNPACFPRPGGTIPIVINTYPGGLAPVACDAAGTACFIAEAGMEYSFTFEEGTDADSLVAPIRLDEPDIHKWYFGKQNPPFTSSNPKLPFPMATGLTLNDYLVSRIMNANFLQGLMNPAGKNEDVHPARDDHYSCYGISDTFGLPQPAFFPPGNINIETTNFGQDTARVGVARELCLSAMKNTEGSITSQGYKCYDAKSNQTGFPVVTLDDQFDDQDGPRQVQKLSRFCTPVGKNIAAPDVAEDPENPDTWDHLACYEIPRSRISPFIDVDLGDMLIQNAVNQKIVFSVEYEQRFCERAINLDLVP